MQFYFLYPENKANKKVWIVSWIEYSITQNKIPESQSLQKFVQQTSTAALPTFNLTELN